MTDTPDQAAPETGQAPIPLDPVAAFLHRTSQFFQMEALKGWAANRDLIAGNRDLVEELLAKQATIQAMQATIEVLQTESTTDQTAEGEQG